LISPVRLPLRQVTSGLTCFLCGDQPRGRVNISQHAGPQYFEQLHRATEHPLLHPGRRSLFEALPDSVQAAVWRELRERCNRFAEAQRREPFDTSQIQLANGVPEPRPALKVAPVPFKRSTDDLGLIPPPDYFRVLCGLEVVRGYVHCPLHAERNPSCQVYQEAARGWYCRGCNEGGDIYELAGELWGLTRYGASFTELRERLEREFFR